MILLTDLDGTLLGDEAALDRFHAWWEANRHQCVLIFATGRTADDVASLVGAGVLPRPTFTIGALGTEVFDHANGGIAAVGPRFGSSRWDTRLVHRALSPLRAISPQPAEFQAAYKVSFYLERASEQALAEVRETLTSARLDFELLYSGDRFLDVLPRGVSKGATATLLASKLGRESAEVIACGDSGNDVSLYQQGFRGVIVGNAEPALLNVAPADVYRSPRYHADGVLDGIAYWEDDR